MLRKYIIHKIIFIYNVHSVQDADVKLVIHYSHITDCWL